MKINTMSFFLISIFTAICVSSIILWVSIEERVLLSTISRGGYSENAIHFRINEETWSFAKLIDLVIDSDHSNFTIIHDDYQNNIRQIYIKGKSTSLPMVSGRYFCESDFNVGRSFAVIGRNQVKNIIDDNGVQRIQVEGKLFDVIGVVGHRIDTVLDDMIIVNADALLQKAYHNNVFVLDAYSGKTRDLSTEIYNELELKAYEGFPSGLPLPMVALEINPGGVDRLFKNIISLTMTYILLMICYMLCSIAISFEWVSRQRRKIAVKRLVGWSDKKLKLDIYKDYFIFASLGIGVGIVIMWFWGVRITKIESFFGILILNVIFGWLITIPPIKKMLKVPVAEALR
ncbi:FtsX-like permease family protein [Clostridium formicaceticum]|uniref:MacB-like periplasmic core domain protein n=1 Tax=Clostridium formicaceticum TaxID=1497 RepID=A0AAC9RJA8_9CLOT|nr:FtsX-like permease family protein [Clostridium formicaceticum]AOY77583.1 hypothetical protein BJL90_18010 [Clostridium formicaceticum]ARE88161.1 MacB-like periplasmic core domain protein [Clostridium formicaceticum]